MIGELVVMTAKHQSACHLSGLCHQFGAVPNSLELLRYRKLPLWNTLQTSTGKSEEERLSGRGKGCIVIEPKSHLFPID